MAADLVAQGIDFGLNILIFGNRGHIGIILGGNSTYIIHAVRKAFLIYNPASGRKKAKRAHAISRVIDTFRGAGVEVEAVATTHAGSAIQQAREAAGAGFDTVIACGGDGTVNETLNGVLGSEIALG